MVMYVTFYLDDLYTRIIRYNVEQVDHVPHVPNICIERTRTTSQTFG